MAEEKGTMHEGISDSDKLGALVDMIKDACAKLDSVAERQDAAERRLDSMEADRKDSAKRDEDEDEIKRPGEAREPAADKRKDAAKRDEEEDEKRDDEEEDEKRDDADDFDTLKAARGDKRKDADDEEERHDADEEEGMADYSFVTRAEADALQAQIAALSKQMPAILSTADRERFAAVQEQADAAFQAFGDRAPAPLQGETVPAYKRRLGAKMQQHSKRWKGVRLSGVADEQMLDIVLSEVFADSVAAAAAGEGVPAGQLREKVIHSGGHTIVEFHGSPDTWMNAFAGVSQRAVGSWAN